MSLFEPSPYLYATGDRPYPTSRPLSEEMRITPKSLDEPRAPRVAVTELSRLLPGERATVRSDALLNKAAAGDVTQVEQEIVQLDYEDRSVVDETAAYVDEPPQSPTGDVVTEPPPAPPVSETPPPAPVYVEPPPVVNEAPPPPPPPPPAPAEAYVSWCETQNYGYDDNGQPVLVRVCHDNQGNTWMET